MGVGGEVYLFIFHQRLEKRICDQLHVAPMLICMLSFSENYNLVSRLIKSLCPYGSILSELTWAFCGAICFYRHRKLGV